MGKRARPVYWSSSTLAAFSFLLATVALVLPAWLGSPAAPEPFHWAHAAAPGGPNEASAAEHGQGSRWGSLVASVNPSLTEPEADEIGRAVVRYSGLYGLPPGLIVAIIRVESGADLFAVSPKGAQGLMQVMPFWKKELGIEGTLFDIDNNIRAGCHILAENIRRWGYKEGILRYYRGGLPVSGERYFVRVQAALKGMD